ncbi:MAG: hypothetical protein WDN30_03925 [Pararobbsia sp.]
MSWSKGKLGYALIGKRSDVDLPALQRQIDNAPAPADASIDDAVQRMDGDRHT